MLFMLLCGCGKFDVTCSIDEWNNAEMKINIEILKSGMTEDDKESFEYTTYLLYDYWEDMGYLVNFNFVGDSYDITLKKRTLAKSREAALNAMLEMMGSDTSPFSSVEGGYSGSYFSDIYNIKAEVDLSKTVDYEYIDSLPPSQKNKILDTINNFSGTVTFDLPGETKDYAGNMKDGKNTVSLSLDQTAEIYSLMEVQNVENKQNYDALVDKIAQLEKEKQQYTLIVIAAGGALAVIILVSVILLIRRKKGMVQ